MARCLTSLLFITALPLTGGLNVDNTDNFTILVPDFRELPEGDVTTARELWETAKEAEKARKDFTSAFADSQKVFGEVLQVSKRPPGSRFTQVEQTAKLSSRTPVDDRELSRGMYITQPFRKNPMSVRIYDGEHEEAMLEEAKQAAQEVQAARMAEAISEEITQMGRQTIEERKDKTILNEISNLNTRLKARQFAGRKAYRPPSSDFGVAASFAKEPQGAAGSFDCTPRMQFRQTKNGPIGEDDLVSSHKKTDIATQQIEKSRSSADDQNAGSSLKVVNVFTKTASDLPVAVLPSRNSPVHNGFYGRTKVSI